MEDMNDIEDTARARKAAEAELFEPIKNIEIYRNK